MSKKLLLADDSITIQKVIQITFAHEDYDLTITDNGDAALAKARELKPDLVMADVYMPGKNGYELTTAIKQDPALKNTPVLLLAGSFEPFDEEKARSCQADAWIEKPFESQNLIDKVAGLLKPAPSAAPVPQPAAAAGPVVEDKPPLADFDQPLTTAGDIAAEPDDVFGDISFDDETQVFAPEPVAAANDWSDVAAEAEVVTPVVEESDAVVEEPGSELAEDFSFAEDAQAATGETASSDEGVDLADFDMTEEEIMPLGEDDILGAEDLEPVPEEQTLAAWSRDASPEQESFVDPTKQMPAVENDVFAAEEAPFVEAPVTASAPAAAAALSESEIEQVIEKVVTKVVEKLAGSILERVAWEVVPDLAETLIREEIRKIKDAAA